MSQRKAFQWCCSHKPQETFGERLTFFSNFFLVPALVLCKLSLRDHLHTVRNLGPYQICLKLLNYHVLSILVILVFLPAATKLWPRLCVYTCVILFTGGVSGQGEPPRAGKTPPPGQGEPPLEQTPPRSRHPPPGSRLQHTVNERPVRILLECILVESSLSRAILPSRRASSHQAKTGEASKKRTKNKRQPSENNFAFSSTFG